MTRKWIQKAVKRTSAKGRRQVKAGSVQEIHHTGKNIRSQIRFGRLKYNVGIKRLVIAKNLMQANPNISKSDRRIRALSSQIRKTKMLKRG